jgi:hypothetical protein
LFVDNYGRAGKHPFPVWRQGEKRNITILPVKYSQHFLIFIDNLAILSIKPEMVGYVAA